MCMNVTTAVQPKQLLRTVEISKYHILLMYWAGPKTSLGRKGGGEEGRAAAEEGREASGKRERERKSERRRKRGRRAGRQRMEDATEQNSHRPRARQQRACKRACVGKSSGGRQLKHIIAASGATTTLTLLIALQHQLLRQYTKATAETACGRGAEAAAAVGAKACQRGIRMAGSNGRGFGWTVRANQGKQQLAMKWLGCKRKMVAQDAASA